MPRLMWSGRPLPVSPRVARAAAARVKWQTRANDGSLSGLPVSAEIGACRSHLSAGLIPDHSVAPTPSQTQEGST